MRLLEITQFQAVHDKIEHELENYFKTVQLKPNVKQQLPELSISLSAKIQSVIDKIIDDKLGKLVVGPKVFVKFHLDDDLGTNAAFSSQLEPSSSGLLDTIGKYFQKLKTEIRVGYNFYPNVEYYKKNKKWSHQEISRLTNALAHELQHFFQYIARQRINYGKSSLGASDFIEYMSKPQEIEAYSAQAARELVNAFDKDKNLAKQYLQTSLEPDTYLIDKKSTTLAYIIRNKTSFPQDILQKYIKKIYQYIDIV